jgi:single-stranded-DNA-specific exonuclease
LKILKHILDIRLTSRSDIYYDQTGRGIHGGDAGNSIITFKGKPHQADGLSINPVIALNGFQKRFSLFPVLSHLIKRTFFRAHGLNRRQSQIKSGLQSFSLFLLLCYHYLFQLINKKSAKKRWSDFRYHVFELSKNRLSAICPFMIKWNILEPKTEVVNRLSAHLQCSPVVASLLANRAIDSPAQAVHFLTPSFHQLSNPSAMKDMDTAVSRIHNAILRQERILIFGDYDVDGVTGTVLITDFLNTVGAKVSFYIPHRETEGYGLKPCHINDPAISNSINLIITVDCGSSSHEAVRMAHRAGIDVIITDHHTISNPIPEALAVVNPRRNDCPSGAGNLAGVGVAFFLVISLRKYLRDQEFWTFRNEPNLKSACDLVALGTVADMVPLTGDNRILVKGGIDQINSGPRPGIQSLLEISGIHRPFLNSEDIAFKLAPRLNAAGRMGHAKTAAHLLLTRDSQKALKLAETLNALNCERRSVEQRVLDEIHLRLQNEPEYLHAGALVMADAAWPSGILGIVASRLVHRFFRPVVLISTQKGTCRGSARSLPGFDLYQGLKDCSDSLIGFGGHAAAAGLEISAERIPEFQSRFTQMADSRISREQLIPEMAVDGILDIQDITSTLIDEIEALKPYGTGNPEPLFLAKNIHIASSGIVGRNTRRMILKPRDGSSCTSISAVQFNVDSPLPIGSEIREMVYRLRWNFWNGNRTPQILVEDAIFSLQSPMSESIMSIDDGLISVKNVMTYQDP